MTCALPSRATPGRCGTHRISVAPLEVECGTSCAGVAAGHTDSGILINQTDSSHAPSAGCALVVPMSTSGVVHWDRRIHDGAGPGRGRVAEHSGCRAARATGHCPGRTCWSRPRCRDRTYPRADRFARATGPGITHLGVQLDKAPRRADPPGSSTGTPSGYKVIAPQEHDGLCLQMAAALEQAVDDFPAQR